MVPGRDGEGRSEQLLDTSFLNCLRPSPSATHRRPCCPAVPNRLRLSSSLSSSRPKSPPAVAKHRAPSSTSRSSRALSVAKHHPSSSSARHVARSGWPTRDAGERSVPWIWGAVEGVPGDSGFTEVINSDRVLRVGEEMGGCCLWSRPQRQRFTRVSRIPHC
jgi:hypothetical protein